MKRFTETLKWADPWFRRLSAPAKMLWFYAVDHCDNIGIVELDLDFVSKDCGLKINATHLSELGNRVESIGEDKYFLPKFIQFQYGQLSSSCPAHKKVLQALEMHCIVQDALGYHYPNARVTGRVIVTLQDKDKDSTGKEEGNEGKQERPPIDKARCSVAEAIAYTLELGLSAGDGEWFAEKCRGNGWKNGGSPILDWKATIRAWKAAGYMPSQKGSQAPLNASRNNQPRKLNQSCL
jgi:hypothetical protein